MKIIKKLLKYVGIFILVLISYVLIMLLLPLISVNDNVSENQKEIPIYILTNGVHTDIVLPLKNEHQDWSNQLKFEHTIAKDITRHIPNTQHTDGLGLHVNLFFTELALLRNPRAARCNPARKGPRP